MYEKKGGVIMQKHYFVTDQEIREVEPSISNFTILEQASFTEREQLLKDYSLPQDVFNFFDMPAVAPRIEYLTNPYLGDTLIFVLANISESPGDLPVEKRLESHTFILGEEKLIWIINGGNSDLDEEITDEIEISSQITLESVILSIGLQCYKNFEKELYRQKDQIDFLDEQANHKTSNQLLIDIASTEKNMVMLEHTLDVQERAFSQLLNDENFLQRLNDEKLVHDIKWYNRQVNLLVHLYRDLLETVSGLYSAIMSNNLNSLMKFLSSISLILASSGLIAELWGMNTGGLPGENHSYGTLIMFSLAFLSGLSMYIYLNKKNFFDD